MRLLMNTRNLGLTCLLLWPFMALGAAAPLGLALGDDDEVGVLATGIGGNFLNQFAYLLTEIKQNACILALNLHFLISCSALNGGLRVGRQGSQGQGYKKKQENSRAGRP